MSRMILKVRYRVRVSRKCAAVACVVVALVTALGPRALGERPGRVVIVTLPGFRWDTFQRANVPSLRSLIDRGAVAAMSIRSVLNGSTPIRGYLTMGAGNRAYTPLVPPPRRDEQTGQLALPASAPFENGTAAAAMARRVSRPRAGGIVAPDVPALDALGKQYSYGTHVGALGSELARHRIARAVVVAGDLETSPRTESMRRGAVLSIADASGTVDTGRVGGLLRPVPGAPFGVETDPAVFSAAVERALHAARVVVIEPGETLRADEFALEAKPDEAAAQEVRSMERADALIGRVEAMLGSNDVLYVVGISSPLADIDDHLTLAVAKGAGIIRGWLTSPTTHRPGIVTLTDMAPTVLDRFGIAIPEWMSGTPIESVASSASDRIATLAALDEQSTFGDQFQGVFAKLLVSILVALAAVLGAVLLTQARLTPLLRWLAFAALAVPPAAYVVRIARVDRMGIVAATIVACGVVALLATLARLLPVTAWKAALVLVGLSFAITTGDLLAGAPLQLNNVFGYSPIAAGRFYGDSNIEFSVMTATAIIGVFGLLQLRGTKRVPAWTAPLLGAVVAVEGLPQFGADFGGIAASVPALLVAYASARRDAVRLRRYIGWAVAGAAAGAAAMLVDAARPPEARTHLGRFAARLLSGGAPGALALVSRKVQSNIGLLGSAWVWTVPVAIAVYVLVRWKAPDALARKLRTRRLACAGLAGTLVAGVLGFAVNDTGIWVLGMTLAHAVPFFVLLVMDRLDA